jgi:hypothetical protein
MGVLPLAVNWKLYGVPLVPPGSGLVLVIVGTIPLMVKLKVVGPAVPAELMADIDIMVVAIAFGVPVNRPPADNEAQAGKPVPLQLIGWVPLAAN